MQEYLENGRQLGWLLIPELKQMAIYGPQIPAQVLNQPTYLWGDLLLPGLRLELECVFGL
ncbi:MAG: hypothetical protein Q6J68_06565 [Thermostichales cyanobacterium SZTDM-1c_bins_54]